MIWPLWQSIVAHLRHTWQNVSHWLRDAIYTVYKTSKTEYNTVWTAWRFSVCIRKEKSIPNKIENHIEIRFISFHSFEWMLCTVFWCDNRIRVIYLAHSTVLCASHAHSRIRCRLRCLLLNSAKCLWYLLLCVYIKRHPMCLFSKHILSMPCHELHSVIFCLWANKYANAQKHRERERDETRKRRRLQQCRTLMSNIT